MDTVIDVSGLEKTYASGHQALKGIDLQVRRGEIFALLGPNGAGKTTLIGVICGLVRPSAGSIRANGCDIARDYRAARAAIGLVPQELPTDLFARVWDTVSFSRGLFGKRRDAAHIERVLRDLSLWDKKDSRIVELSGGMKRRVLIAKALAHEPSILFLDEPTAGVDVELRRDMWRLVRRLRENGVTIILTTHYLEEAEEMADRIGVIDQGELVLVEEKHALMRQLGQTRVTIGLAAAMQAPPQGLDRYALELSPDGRTLTWTLAGDDQGSVADLVKRLAVAGIDFETIDTSRSSLEDIFVSLIGDRSQPATEEPRA